LLAAAALWSARRTDFFCLPGFGLQLPFSPAALPGVGSKPGQQCCDEAGFLLLFFLGDDLVDEDFLAAGVMSE
jgi:hypothetical protein